MDQRRLVEAHPIADTPSAEQRMVGASSVGGPARPIGMFWGIMDPMTSGWWNSQVVTCSFPCFLMSRPCGSFNALDRTALLQSSTFLGDADIRLTDALGRNDRAGACRKHGASYASG